MNPNFDLISFILGGALGFVITFFLILLKRDLEEKQK